MSKRKLNIGIVCYPTYGGSGVLATELGMALADLGHNIHFISYRQPVRLDQHFSNNISFHEVRPQNYPLFEFPPYELTLIGKMIDVVKFEKLDVLHVHYAIPHAFSAYNAKLILESDGYSIPVVTTLHGTDVTLVGKDKSVLPVVTYSINQSDRITVVSEFLKEETIAQFQIKKDIQVIYNFVDINRFSRKSFSHFRTSIAPNDERILVHTSNFRKVKRVEDAMKVFAKIRKTMPAKFLMIGDGPERSNLEDLCRSLDLCDDVRFLGKISSVEDILSIADLFILPSATESFGLAALEAMACECPVISTNAGGLPEVNIQGVTGYLSNVGDIENMSANAIKILSDISLHTKMKAAALEQAKRFDLSEILKQYENLYYELVE